MGGIDAFDFRAAQRAASSMYFTLSMLQIRTELVASAPEIRAELLNRLAQHWREPKHQHGSN